MAGGYHVIISLRGSKYGKVMDKSKTTSPVLSAYPVPQTLKTFSIQVVAVLKPTFDLKYSLKIRHA